MTVDPADWLSDAVCYEIYPQSFADSNGDGVGDMPGVLAHLDHLQWLGINTIWFNPCFASPFIDAGYDVSDYLRVAPRYGTNGDLLEVIDAAKARGIRVLLDLVAGHTSTAHSWFQAELRASAANPLGDRYIWSDRPGKQLNSAGAPGATPWVPSPGPRAGYYLKNFYDEQPALNFGYARFEDDEPGGRLPMPLVQCGTGRRCATSWRSGSTAVSPGSGWTWRSPWSRMTPGFSRALRSGGICGAGWPRPTRRR